MALPPDRTDRGAERYLKDDWHGLQLFAIDGAQFRTPDKPELREYYGSANTSTKRQNAYPVMRLVALMNLGKSHSAECRDRTLPAERNCAGPLHARHHPG